MANHKVNISIGDQFERLTVISEQGKDSIGNRLFLCRCSCGKEIVATGSSLKLGRVKSCGCLKSELAKHQKGFHGLQNESVYNSWSSMIQRCTNPKHPQYQQYGGRGITVCDEWLDFKTFYDWAKSSNYKNGLTIERKNVNKGYCPENCTFIPKEDQCMNKQNTIRYKGEVLKIACKRLGLSYTSVHSRIKKLGWSVERAVETPFRKRKVKENGCKSNSGTPC